ncbi:MAG: hypothetical protein O2895_02235 [Chloroflexi bacterium]|nr:hypothetical protein [Chloroflexota bacterium]
MDSVVHDIGHTDVGSGPVATGDFLHSQVTVIGGGDTPTGDVAWTVFASSDCSGTPLFSEGSLPLAGGIVETPEFAAPTAGTYSYFASYLGDGAYEPAVSNCDSLNVVNPPPDHSGEVLILSTTVYGGTAGTSNEAAKVSLTGRTPVTVDAATWSAMTTADFASYDAIILGDNCSSLSSAQAAIDTVDVWSPAIDGNVVIVGTDPSTHLGSGGDAVNEKTIAFAVDQAGTTGALISLGCYYHATAENTPVPLLDGFGSFTLRGVGCFNESHIVAIHPALSGLTDANLSNWSCSVHEAFDGWPTSSFIVLAIAEGIGGSYTAGDGSVGTPYILARGKGLIAVGDPVAAPAPPPPAEVTIIKEVVGDEAPAGATFTFRLECLGPDFDFSLGAGESFTASISQNTLCSLTETDTQGAESVSGEFSDVLIDGNRTITVTNTFPNFPEVLGTAITKTLVSASPAALGESVRFDIGVTFTGGPLRNVELVDVYEHDVLGFEGVYVGSTRLDCQVFAGVPDSGHSTVACAIGEVTGPFTVQARFDALAGTLPGRSVNHASVISDQDGAGGDPPTTTGPVSAGVEIVQVLALPPLGDGATHSSSAAATMLFAALAALGLVLGGRRLTRLASSER